MKLVSLFMDVEDPINAHADDAALDFASLLSSLGERGSFCVTGEKCRKLVERGRRDVLDALSSHCLGLHTDTHSYHPTTMELLADMEYYAGCDAAFVAESRGAEAFQAAFGRSPAFWGGAGNTWSPEIPQAIVRLNISTYAYALTELPGKPVHWFNGAFALPQSVSISEDALTDDPDAITRTVASIVAMEQPWVGVFVGHPTRYRYPEFWDRSFFAGRTPDIPDELEPAPKERYLESLRNFRALIEAVRSKFQVVGVDDLLKRPWNLEYPNGEQLAYFRQATATNLLNAAKWPIHRPNLNPANIVQKTMALSDTLRTCLPTW
jgi:hypothetical protein